MTTTTHILALLTRISAKLANLNFTLKNTGVVRLTNQSKQLGSELRNRNWNAYKPTLTNLSFATAGDFAWYDHVLTTTLLLGHVPKRHAGGSEDEKSFPRFMIPCSELVVVNLKFNLLAAVVRGRKFEWCHERQFSSGFWRDQVVQHQLSLHCSWVQQRWLFLSKLAATVWWWTSK